MPGNLAKKNLTVRLDPETRAILEVIAKGEYRTLANQIHVFLEQGITRYLNTNNLRVVRTETDGKPHVALVSTFLEETGEKLLDAAPCLPDFEPDTTSAHTE